MNVGYVYKAIYGAVAAFVASLVVVVSGNETLSQITLAQWLVAASAAIVAGGAVFGVTNAPARTKTPVAEAPTK